VDEKGPQPAISSSPESQPAGRRRSPRPSPTWRTFLEAHLREIAAVDFFVVRTLTFRRADNPRSRGSLKDPNESDMVLAKDNPLQDVSTPVSSATNS